MSKSQLCCRITQNAAYVAYALTPPLRGILQFWIPRSLAPPGLALKALRCQAFFSLLIGPPLACLVHFRSIFKFCKGFVRFAKNLPRRQLELPTASRGRCYHVKKSTLLPHHTECSLCSVRFDRIESVSFRLFARNYSFSRFMQTIVVCKSLL